MKYLNMGAAASERQSVEVRNFGGVDLTSAAPVVELSRSPYAPNMLRDVPGKVRKRMGYQKLSDFGARINGVHSFPLGDSPMELIHAGDKLFDEAGTVLYSGLSDARSGSFVISGKMYIADGRCLLCYDGTRVYPASEEAYCPTLTIGRAPAGGGTDHEAVNMLGGRFKELFEGDGQSRVYQLSLTGLDSTGATVRIMDSAGSFCDSPIAYTVDAALGTVSFASPPPAPSTAGSSNIEITAEKTDLAYAARINGCTIGVLFGVNGSQDRLFLSGNVACANLDFHSGFDNPTYFADTAFCRLGQDGCRVMGYAASGNRLITFKDRDADGRSVVIRSGSMENGKAVFPIENMLTGASAVSKHCFAQVGGEPLFLSDKGVFAITKQDQTAAEYTQNRSYYLNRALCAEEGLEDAVSVCFNDFYMISVGGRLYLLDTLCKQYQKNEPYSSYQYEGYLLTGIDARVLYVKSGRLRFGDRNGGIYEFFSDPDDAKSYSDCGRPIAACWTTPEFSGDTFYRYKDLTMLALKMQPSPVTSVRVQAKVRGVYRDITNEQALCRYLKFSAVQFSKLNFSCDADPRVLVTRPRLKKTECSSLRFENSGLCEPFSLLELGIIYRKTGYIRGSYEKN